MSGQDNLPQERQEEQALELLVKHLAFNSSPEIVSYEMQSHRGKILEVPKRYAEIAQAIVSYVITGKGDTNTGILTSYFIRNIGILSVFSQLANATKGLSVYGAPFERFSNETLRLQDELYFRVCINLNEHRMQTSERGQAFTLHALLADALSRILKH